MKIVCYVIFYQSFLTGFYHHISFTLHNKQSIEFLVCVCEFFRLKYFCQDVSYLSFSILARLSNINCDSKLLKNESFNSSPLFLDNTRIKRKSCEDAEDIYHCFHVAVIEDGCDTQLGGGCSYSCGMC